MLGNEGFSNWQPASLPGMFKFLSQGRMSRINSKFRMHSDFSMKPDFKNIFDFSTKPTFGIRFDFGFKPNFRIRFDFSIKPNFSCFGKETFNW